MKILITGASGYIGRALNKHLMNNHQVYTPTHSCLDLTNFESVKNYFKDKYFDVVLHCAAVGGNRLIKDDVKVMDTNLLMYYNLQQFPYWEKFINFGSGAEIYHDTFYGLSKSIIRKSILEKPNHYNIRLYGVFDENELDRRFIKSCLTNYINRQPMLVDNKKMSFFYMKDLLTIIDYYIENRPNMLIKEYECTYMESTSLLDIANYINTLDDYKVPIYINQQKSDDYEVSPNDPYDFNYIGLEEGIKEVYSKLIKLKVPLMYNTIEYDGKKI